jgi:ADP-ribose pyrophosphatase YjhB (NUDIX family)
MPAPILAKWRIVFSRRMRSHPMISFDTDGHRFNLRAVAVILSGDHVLLHRLDGDEYWSLPGGRVEAGEDAATAVAREMREELDIAVTVGRLLWIAENFFTDGARSYHEVGLYFATDVPADARILDLHARHAGDEQGRGIEFVWFKRTALANIDVRPAFLRDALAQEVLQFAHIVSRAGG